MFRTAPWYPGTAEIQSARWLCPGVLRSRSPRGHTSLFQLRTAECFWLLGTFLWLSFDSQVLSVWRLALCSIPRALRQVHSSGLFPLHPRSASHLHKCDLAVVSLASKQVNRQEVSSTTLDIAQTRGVSRWVYVGFFFPECSVFLRPLVLMEAREPLAFCVDSVHRHGRL